MLLGVKNSVTNSFQNKYYNLHVPREKKVFSMNWFSEWRNIFYHNTSFAFEISLEPTNKKYFIFSYNNVNSNSFRRYKKYYQYAIHIRDSFISSFVECNYVYWIFRYYYIFHNMKKILYRKYIWIQIISNDIKINISNIFWEASYNTLMD